MENNSEKANGVDYKDVRQNMDFGAYDFRGKNFNSKDGFLLGLSMAEQYDGDFVVGNDHREESSEIKNAVKQGLQYHSDREIIDIGLAPTDMVSYITQNQGVAGGVAVTASHMPPGYHGLKPLNSEGRILDEDELNQVTEGYVKNMFSKTSSIEGLQFDPEEYVESSNDTYVSQGHLNEYIDAVQLRFNELFDTDLSGMEIGVDPGHGIGALTLRNALEGLNADTYCINTDLDPEFPYRDPDPTKDSLEDLTNLVLENDLDMGVATDGDADRAVFINEEGEQVTGDETLAILSKKYLGNTEHEEAAIACSANTSALVQEEINNLGGVVNYQPVGAVFTAKAALNDDGPKTVFGGQPNGHYLDAQLTPYDSGTLMATIMPGILQEENQGLSKLQQDLPEYIIRRGNEDVKDKEAALQRMVDSLDNHSEPVPGTIKGFKNGQLVTLRPSGTEQVIRKMVETPHPRKTLGEIGEDKSKLELFPTTKI